jgi:kynurenine formamidase
MPKPPYADLPNGDAQGVFGAEDVLGTLNRQTPDAILAGAAEIRAGRMFSLNAPMNWPDPPLFNREAYRHTLYQTAMGNRDDFVDGLYPQASSQWDGLLHISDPEIGSYNHLAPEVLGIESWATRGIAGRGVLLDVARHLEERGDPLHWGTRREISVAELDATREAAGVEMREGDIVMVRTGWAAGYNDAPREAQVAAKSRLDSPGLAATEDMAAYLWDWGASAVAGDNVGLEALPLLDDGNLHRRILVRMGMPIGELWLLDDLAEYAASAGRWTSFVTSAPLNLPGGVGSPANVLAFA